MRALIAWLVQAVAKRVRLAFLRLVLGDHTLAAIESAPVDRAAFKRTMRDIDRLPVRR